MTQPTSIPSLFEDGQIGSGITTPDLPKNNTQTNNLIDLLHDGFYLVFLLRNRYIPENPSDFREKILDLLHHFEQQAKR